MDNQKLKDYIKQARESKTSNEQIRKDLSGVGWSNNEIDKAINDSPKFKSLGLIIVVIFLVIVGSGLAYYFYFSPTSEPETTESENQVQPNTLPLRNAERKAKIFQLSSTLKQYKEDHGHYPEQRGQSIAGTGIFSDNLEENPLVPEYQDAVIKDPLNNEDFFYDYYPEENKYLLYVKLENEESSNEDQYFCVDSYTVESPTTVSFDPLLKGRCKEEITQEEEVILNSSALISRLRQINLGIEMYQSENGYFPKNLIDLYPTSIANKDILEDENVYYASYPAENPNKYHIGIKISGDRNELNEDNDFDSQSAGYINGFNGADPIYDLTN